MKKITISELNKKASEIAKWTKKFEKNITNKFLELGEIFSDAKQICFRERIHWNKWVKEHTEFTVQHADRLIMLHKKALITPEIKVLSYTKALDMIKKQTESKVQPSNSRVTTNHVKKELTPEDKQKEKIFTLEEENKMLRRDLQKVESNIKLTKVGCQKCMKYENLLDGLEQDLPSNIGDKLIYTRKQLGI